MTAIKSKIKSVINRLQLNLEGKVVLTEAATGAYVVTPVIAALAGAKVYAFTKETRYGSVDEVKAQTLALYNEFNTGNANLHIIDKLTPEIIAEADIITNSGHLRPLNQELLKHVKKNAVIPLMYEAWERRDADLDLDYCKASDIRVGATNENHPDIDVFNYLGDMALKMIFEAGLCLNNNRFILICNNHFGPFIAKVLSENCKSLAVCDKKEHREKYKDLKIDWIGDFPDFTVPSEYRECDAILFTAYPFDKIWISKENAPILTDKLKSEIENPYVLRYCGHIDERCKDEIRFYPEHVKPGHMGILPSAVGFDPVIRLQAGGLKVGELLLKKANVHNQVQILDLLN